MPSLTINRSTPIVETPRTQQLLGMFDIPPSERSERTWQVQIRDAVEQALAAGWTVKALADAAEVDDPKLYMWLSGRRGLGLQTLESLARFFGQRLTAPRLRRP